MPGKPAARLGDPTECPKKGHTPASITSGSSDVLINGLPAARIGDQTSCGSTLAGNASSTVLINGKPALTIGSTGNHGEVIIGGSGTPLSSRKSCAAGSVTLVSTIGRRSRRSLMR
mgnify:CR=1 FL=1